jgi:hypothetical protein
VVGQHGGEHAAGDQPRAIDHAKSRERAAHSRSL